jgi:hypothetical protein
VIGHSVFQAQAVEPTIRKDEMNLLAKAAFGANAETVAHDQHANHELRVDRRPASVVLPTALMTHRNDALPSIDESIIGNAPRFGGSPCKQNRPNPVCRDRPYWRFDSENPCGSPLAKSPHAKKLQSRRALPKTALRETNLRAHGIKSQRESFNGEWMALCLIVQRRRSKRR